jgi:hypothetical protein
MKVTEADSLVLEPAHMKGGEAASSPAQNQERGTKANSPDSYAFVKQKKGKAFRIGQQRWVQPKVM